MPDLPLYRLPGDAGKELVVNALLYGMALAMLLIMLRLVVLLVRERSRQ